MATQPALIVPSETEVEEAADRVVMTRGELVKSTEALEFAKAAAKADREAHQQAITDWLKLRAQRKAGEPERAASFQAKVAVEIADALRGKDEGDA